MDNRKIYVIEKIFRPPFGSSGKEAFTKEEIKKYIIENIDWLLMLDSNEYFIVEKIKLYGSDKEC